MFEPNQPIFCGAGGVGDCLMVLNKLITLGLNDGLHTLTWYCSNEKYKKHAEELGVLNGVYVIGKVVSNPDVYIKAERDNGLHNILTATWNGDISNDLHAQKSFEADEVTISDICRINGVLPVYFPSKDYFLVQADAGVIYHNERKHWKDFYKVQAFCVDLGRIYNLDYVIFGGNFSTPMTSDFIVCPEDGFQVVEYLKKAKFAITLSGFGALCSLMCGAPTIYKSEGDFVHRRCYARWGNSGRMLPIQEINEDKENILNFIEKVL